MMRGRGNTELQFNPLYTTLPRLPKEAQGGFQAIFLDHQDHWFSNVLKQQTVRPKSIRQRQRC